VIRERTGRGIRTIDICALEAIVAYGKLVVYWIVEDVFGGMLYVRLGMSRLMTSPPMRQTVDRRTGKSGFEFG